ncbi:hypothetical protein BpHYR1_038689 [Brachionus plicatilis]|uniref:Uncharacterized protein n=1 Tax=Brachionus plicatilis TaxID=10195 RepID=A0A3M7RTT5_BRAPC|nr:hypothetical protein BpHYR1_038689 [Brachionus plicatilis]
MNLKFVLISKINELMTIISVASLLHSFLKNLWPYFSRDRKKVCNTSVKKRKQKNLLFFFAREQWDLQIFINVEKLKI